MTEKKKSKSKQHISALSAETASTDMAAVESKNCQKEDVATLSLEELFQRLEQIHKQMEQEEIGLEESFRLYREGVSLLEQCHQAIDTVEKQVLALDEKGNTHAF